jgi:glycosyltransferase involved in cell wall biosynthesis
MVCLDNIMQQPPHVTVIISTYNRADWLVEAIHTVLAQSYQDFELVIVDDASTDNTAVRMAEFGEAVRYIRLPQHLGQPESVKNHGIAAAKGSLIALLDDDDTWRSDKLAQQVAVFNKRPEVGFVYTDFCFVYEDGSHSAALLSPHHLEAERAFDHLLENCFIHPSTAVFRRTVYDRLAPLGILPILDDYYFLLRATHATVAACIAEPLVAIRRHQGSISNQRGIQNYEALVVLLEHLLSHLQLNSRQRFLSRRALARTHTHIGLHQLQEGQIKQARRHFNQSLRANPLQRRAWLALGESFFARL